MKRKLLTLAVALLIAGGLWFARTRQPGAPDKSSVDVAVEKRKGETTIGEAPNPSARLTPPDQVRKFREFTPEQRVEFARKGHGPGG